MVAIRIAVCPPPSNKEMSPKYNPEPKIAGLIIANAYVMSCIIKSNQMETRLKMLWDELHKRGVRISVIQT